MSSYTESKLLSIAHRIQELSSEIVTHLNQSNHPEPNFSTISPDVPSNKEYDRIRNALNDATSDLFLLVNGPKAHARKLYCMHHDLAAHQVAFDFDFFNSVPQDCSIELSALAKKVGLDVDHVGRVMRLLCTQRIFEETSKNEFSHTSVSIIIAQDKQLKDAAHYQLDEMFKAAAETSVYIQNKSMGKDTAKSPFEQRHGVPLFTYYERNPKLAARFASAMAGIAKVERHIVELRDGFPWNTIKEGKVVDIGGGSGHISISLAREFPNLNIIVQDASQDMLSQAKKQDLSDLGERISFMQHNFFDIQPITGAAAYFIRQCLHNWSDDECVKILKGLVPAMEKCMPGTPLLINDIILPELNKISKFEEHSMRQLDMLMFVALGAKQRTAAEFEHLLKRADRRFEIKKMQSEGSMGLIEVNLNFEENGIE